MHYISLNSIPEKPNKKHTNQQSEGNVINSPDIIGGGEGGRGVMVTLKYDFAHMTFWVDIVLIEKNLDGFQAN